MWSNILVCISVDHAFISSLALAIPVDIVDFSVFNLEGFLGLGERLESLEVVEGHVVAFQFKDGRLVHVVPCPDVGRGFQVFIKAVLRSPAFSCFLVQEIEIDAVTWPAFSNERLVVMSSDKQVFFKGFFVDMVFVIDLNMGISNGDELSFIVSKGPLHGEGIREELIVPCEVPAFISMIDIKSNGITRDLMLIELIIDEQDFFLIFIGPSALVVAEREVLWHGAVSEYVCEAFEVKSVGVAHKEVAFQIPSFTEPEGLFSSAFFVNVNVSVGSVLPVH